MSQRRVLRQGQQGVSLFVVMVMVMVSAIAVLGALRVAWLGEGILGNETDYQRTRAAAEALIRDAQIDVLGYLPDGNRCRATEVLGGCRNRENSAGNPAMAGSYLPLTSVEWEEMWTLFGADTVPGTRCVQGICITNTPLEPGWWNTPATLAAMNARAAGYGTFTGAVAPGTNPILSNAVRARYWIEAIRYRTTLVSPAGIQLPPVQPKSDPAVSPVIFRITAIADGLKPGTRVVLQSVVMHPSSI